MWYCGIVVLWYCGIVVLWYSRDTVTRIDIGIK